MQDLVASKLREVHQQLQSGSPLVTCGPTHRSRYFALKLREIQAEMSCLYRIRDTGCRSPSAAGHAGRARALESARG